MIALTRARAMPALVSQLREPAVTGQKITTRIFSEYLLSKVHRVLGGSKISEQHGSVQVERLLDARSRNLKRLGSKEDKIIAT